MFKSCNIARLSVALLLVRSCSAQTLKAAYSGKNGTEHNSALESTSASYLHLPSNAQFKRIASNVVDRMEEEMFEILGVKGKNGHIPPRSSLASSSKEPQLRVSEDLNEHGSHIERENCDNYTENRREKLYRASLSGELAETIVRRILERSVGKKNNVINVELVMDQLNAVTSKIISTPVSQTDNRGSPLAVELKQFLAFLLLQSSTRRKRCDKCVSFNFFPIERRGKSQNGYFPSLRLPVGLYGIQVPNELN